MTIVSEANEEHQARPDSGRRDGFNGGSPPAKPPVNPDNGRPWRLHFMFNEDPHCAKCGFLILTPQFVKPDEPLEPESTRPIATRTITHWRACPFNCELVPPPVGKKQTPIASP